MNNKMPAQAFYATEGMKYEKFDRTTGGHVIRDVTTGKRELWFANKNHASFGVTWRNTHLEFARSL